MHNTTTMTATAVPISELIEDFVVSLEAEGKSRRTIEWRQGHFGQGTGRLADRCLPALARRTKAG